MYGGADDAHNNVLLCPHSSVPLKSFLTYLAHPKMCWYWKCGGARSVTAGGRCKEVLVNPWDIFL
jgi:hypothetical protein